MAETYSPDGDVNILPQSQQPALTEQVVISVPENTDGYNNDNYAQALKQMAEWLQYFSDHTFAHDINGQTITVSITINPGSLTVKDNITATDGDIVATNGGGGVEQNWNVGGSCLVTEDVGARHIQSNQVSSPTITFGYGAWDLIGGHTAATATVINNDMGGTIELTTGQGPTGSSLVLSVEFVESYLHAVIPYLVPANDAAAALYGNANVYVYNASADGFDIRVGSTALAASTLYVWNYFAIGRAS